MLQKNLKALLNSLYIPKSNFQIPVYTIIELLFSDQLLAIMKITFLLPFLFLSTTFFAQTNQQLKDSAATFPPMPRGTVDLLPYVQGFPTFASGAPFNDLDFTLLDTDYMDGENSGFDVFMPVDPADSLPGTDQVKYIRCVLNTDLNSIYGSTDGDRIILGTAEMGLPFFRRGVDGLDNDYVAIQHLDFEEGYIQLAGNPTDYSLIYGTAADGCQTEGWYLFYTANSEIDLIAFIFPCWDISPSVSGNPPNNPNPLCNGDSVLSLTNPNHFRYATPIITTVAITNGIAQVGSNGKEVVGGMTVDQQGNTYLFGLTDGNMDGGADAANELFITKITPSGNQAWVTELPTAEGTMLKAGITDQQFLYVCGRTLGSLPGFSNAGKWDGILLKLDLSNGQIVAMNQWGNQGIDGYGNIAQDDAGHIFVSAQGSPSGVGGTDDVYLVAKHQKSNLNNVWRVLNPPNTTGFIASAEAWGGLTYVPSGSPGVGRLVAGGWYFSATGANAFVSVYENLQLATPSRPHSVIINSSGIRADWVLDNVVDSQGNIYVGGFTTGYIAANPAGQGDAYIIKYSPQLTNPVEQQFGTPQSDLIRKLLIHQDTLYAVGYTYGNYAGTNPDVNLETGDIFIQKLDNNLNLLQGIQFGTPHEDRSFAYLQNGYLYLGGMTEGYLTGPSQGSFDAFVAAVATDDLSFQQPTIVGISSIDNITPFSIYPNPVQQLLHIDLEESSSLVGRGWLSNALGQVVLELPASSLKIDMAGLPSGLYCLHLQLEGQWYNQSILKQ